MMTRIFRIIKKKNLKEFKRKT